MHVYVNKQVLDAASHLRRKLWLSLIPLAPIFLIIPLDQFQEEFLAYTGLSFWQTFAICITFSFAGIFYARKVWRCPVCSAYLGSNMFTKYCPQCYAYVSIPKDTTLVYTDDMSLVRGAALVPTEVYTDLKNTEEIQNKLKRYRTQFIIAIATTVFVGGLASFSDIQSLRIHNELTSLKVAKILVLYLPGTYSYCWCAFFLFYFDEWLLAIKSNVLTRTLMGIYNIDLIKVAFTLLGGLLLTVITFGIFGLVRSYLVWRKIRVRVVPYQ